MPKRDHNSEIGLLGTIAVGVILLMAWGHFTATDDKAFDPSAYLVVLTLIVGAIKERWTQRSVDRATDQLGQSLPRETVVQPSAPPPPAPPPPNGRMADPTDEGLFR